MLRSIIQVSWLFCASQVLAPFAWAALQAPPEVKVPAALGENKAEGSDCDKKPKLTPAPEAAQQGVKNKAVNGMVRLGQLPADKVEEDTAPAQAKFLTPPMETCK